MTMQILYPFIFLAEYEDGTSLRFYGNNEEDCMYKVTEAIEEHGDCVWYSGYNDEDYVAGEYIGRENMIYE